jgi:hypothetical protein
VKLKKDIFLAKKVMFWLWIVVGVLCIFGEITVFQLLPIIGIIAIFWAEIWAGKNLFVLAVVFSILMIIINTFVTFSLIDGLMWLATTLVFVFSEKKIK